MARPRKPTKTKEIAGTIRPAREAANEPEPEGIAECPDFLSAEARREWARVSVTLEKCGLLTSADMAVFAGYCQAWADFRKLTDQLNEMASWTWESEQGYRQQVPEIGMRKEAWVRVMQAGSKLGLDPSSRSGLNVSTKVPKANKFSGRGRRVG